METKTDRRIAKSRTAIQNAFLTLLSARGFDAVTVKEIAELADVSRKTFYLHYVDKHDLLNAIITTRLDELAVICEQKRGKGLVEGTVIWFCYFEERRDFFAALFATESTVSFRYRLLDFMMEQLGQKLEAVDPAKNTEVLRRFMGMAVLGIVEACVLGRLEQSTQAAAAEVGALLEQLITM